jgi:hypothetical protein
MKRLLLIAAAVLALSGTANAVELPRPLIGTWCYVDYRAIPVLNAPHIPEFIFAPRRCRYPGGDEWQMIIRPRQVLDLPGPNFRCNLVEALPARRRANAWAISFACADGMKDYTFGIEDGRLHITPPPKE